MRGDHIEYGSDGGPLLIPRIHFKDPVLFALKQRMGLIKSGNHPSGSGRIGGDSLVSQIQGEEAGSR